MGRSYTHHQIKPHASDVTMPEGDIRDRTDWRDIEATIARWDGTQVGISVIAAKFRLPRAVVAGLVMRTNENNTPKGKK